MELLSVKDLSIAFGGLVALSDVSFRVNKGEIFAIIGPNGAGKTTLFNCISGIYKPQSGQILFEGKEIRGMRPDEIARLGIARTFQNIELFPNMTTMENIMLGRHIHMKTGLFHGAFLWGPRSYAGREEIQNRKRAEFFIDLLDLQWARDRFVGSLPYGTQKLVELARALALEPKLLLLDEPCAGMNAEERQDTIFWIKDVQDQLGVTILLIEHDMRMVMEISDRILVLNFGKPIAMGKPSEIQNNPLVLEAYFGEAGE